MKMLLTSGGIRNETIRAELIELLGRPIAECSALAVFTAMHAMTDGGRFVYRAVSGQNPGAFVTLGWKSVGVLELTALPSVERERWVAQVEAADVLFVDGGDPLYLHHWMRESGLAELLPSLDRTVYVGLSAGSMVLTPRIGSDFVRWTPDDTGDDTTLGLVDFSIFPHLDNPDLPDNTLAAATEWAAGLGNPAYAVDDDTAFSVVDGNVRVVSEGKWVQLSP